MEKIIQRLSLFLIFLFTIIFVNRTFAFDFNYNNNFPGYVRDHIERINQDNVNNQNFGRPPFRFIPQFDDLSDSSDESSDDYFNVGTHNCSICIEDRNPNLFHRLSCGHSYCITCIEGMIDSAIGDRSDVSLVCPQPGCRRAFNAADLSNMGFISLKIMNLRQILAQRQAEIDARAQQGFLSRFKGQNLRTAVRIYLSTKQCPKCHVAIEKNDGCNHMTCGQCNHEFCWLCSQNWRGHSSELCDLKRLQKIAIFGLGAGFVMYGLKSYKELMSKKDEIKNSLISKAKKTKETISKSLNDCVDKIKETVKTVKDSRKNLAQAAIASGTFLALEKNGVNFSQDVLDAAYKNLGYQKYDEIFNQPNYPSLKPLGLEFRNGRLINAGVSIGISFLFRPILNKIFQDKTETAQQN